MAVLDDVHSVKVKTYSQAGPASYATGGFLLDASADFSWVGFVDVGITTRGSLGSVDYETDLNVDAAGAEAMGKAVIKVVREVYDKATVGNVSGNPAGTTVQAAKAATATTTGSSHTHTIDHDHPSTVSSTRSASGVGVATEVADPDNLTAHTHAVDIAAFTGSSGSQTHTHDRSFEYAHDHSVNAPTVTDATASEVGAATNLSGTTFRFTVYGFGRT